MTYRTGRRALTRLVMKAGTLLSLREPVFHTNTERPALGSFGSVGLWCEPRWWNGIYLLH